MDNQTEDDRYFSSYASVGIHEEMIKDTARTKNYQRAIVSNKNLFHGKIVLDVGCGTGILSMFAVDAGAQHVYAVDKSDIISAARKIIQLNNYQDKITFIQSTIEDAQLPVPSVDIIISEWMGYCLLYESMLDSVIFARNRWLCEGGLIFPDVASLFCVGIEDEEFRDEKIEWWNRVYGYNMSPMKEIAISEPLVDFVNKEAVVTTDSLVRRFDLYQVQMNDFIEFESKLVLSCRRKDFIHALVFYFTVEFTACHKPIVLYTGPEARPTHWKQSIFYLTQPIMAQHDQDLCFKTSFSQNKLNKRHLDIKILQCDQSDNDKVIQSRKYTLS
uniref:type I protein arginine methyltransferase n=1 Tax=Myxobolus squamalis TaxID=59785 RepID=A0A6B2G274_MYXSQ